MVRQASEAVQTTEEIIYSGGNLSDDRSETALNSKSIAGIKDVLIRPLNRIDSGASIDHSRIYSSLARMKLDHPSAIPLVNLLDLTGFGVEIFADINRNLNLIESFIHHNLEK